NSSSSLAWVCLPSRLAPRLHRLRSPCRPPRAPRPSAAAPPVHASACPPATPLAACCRPLPLSSLRACMHAVSTLVPGSVDTSPSLQKTQLLDWDNLAPSPEVADHPIKRKDMGIKENLWREARCPEIRSRSNLGGAVEEELLAFQMPLKQSIVD
ncbi:hypothetical protein Taro_056507, partial [Colocasia esculenta]|nr:hypothetical protein [Colocasia esculenta]